MRGVALWAAKPAGWELKSQPESFSSCSVRTVSYPGGYGGGFVARVINTGQERDPIPIPRPSCYENLDSYKDAGFTMWSR
jgi:hypothetical protein